MSHPRKLRLSLLPSSLRLAARLSSLRAGLTVVLASAGLWAASGGCASAVRDFEGSSGDAGSGGEGVTSSNAQSTGANTGGGSAASSGVGGAGGTGTGGAGGTMSSTSTGSMQPCVAGAACLVDLSDCAESEKAAAWQGQTSLPGVYELAYYTSHKGWICMAPVMGGQQGWPVIPEPMWWCGVVVPSCVCSPADGCY